MKVVMAAIDFPPHIIGGEGVFGEKMADIFWKKGIILQVIAPAGPDTQAFDQQKPYRIHRVPVLGRIFLTRMPTFGFQAGRVLKRQTWDLAYLLRPCVPQPAPCVAHFHTTRFSEARGCLRGKDLVAILANALYIPLDIFFARHADRIIVLSKHMKGDVETVAPGCGKKSTVIGNGVDLCRFRPDPEKRAPWGQRILYVGRLDQRKGIMDLLGAVSRIPQVSLSIAGNGPLQKLIAERIDKLGLKKRVRLLGRIHRDKIPELYHTYDLLVLPSHYEGFGLVILEAMASGTPVLTSDACANLGQPVFRSGDVPAMANMIQRLLSDPQTLGTLSRIGIQTASRYEWDAIADQIISVFHQTLEPQQWETRS